MLVHIIRHGQAWNTHLPSGETADPNAPLTEIGRAQAERVAGRLHHLGVDRLIASPMLRAIETAEAIAQTTGLPIEVLTVCYEHRSQDGFECWGARPLRERFPRLVLPEDLEPETWFYGEESVERAAARAERFLDWTREQAVLERWRRTVVVSHGGISRFVLAAILGLPRDALMPIVFDHTAVTTLRVGEQIEILGLNDTAHLYGAAEIDPLAGLTR